MPLPEHFEERVRWCFVAAYMADVIGLLDRDKDQKFAELAIEHGRIANWHDVVEQDLKIDAAFVKGVVKACSKCMNREETLCFILRGLGCVAAESRIHEILPEVSEESDN